MVYCSRKCQIFSSTLCAVIQAAVFMVAMLIPYIILQVQNAGVTKLVTVDQNAFSAQKWADYTTSSLDMTYYLWNASNLDAVLRDTTGNTKLLWTEEGPYKLQKITTLDYDSGTSSSSPSPYIAFRRVTSYKIPDPDTRAMLTDPIVGVNVLWVGAVAKGARGLYQQLVKTQLVAQEANEAIAKNLYPDQLHSERLFYGVLSQLLLSGAAPQFTGLVATGVASSPEAISPGGSRLLSALKILSVGSYLQNAIQYFGSDANLIAFNPAFNLTANSTIAFQTFVGAWAQGAPALPSEDTYSAAAVSATGRLATKVTPNTPATLFLDFELTRPADFPGNGTVVQLTTAAKLFSLESSNPVSLLTITGLRTWGAFLLCSQATRAGGACSAQETQATQVILTTLGADLSPVLVWLLPLIDAVPGVTPLSPAWRRNYTLTTVSNTLQVYLYTAKSPRERFQQIIVSGIGAGVTGSATLTGLNPLYAPYAFAAADYPFAPDGAITSNENATLAAAQVAIQSFYDLAILQYATGMVVSLALKPATQQYPGPQEFKGISAADNRALGASAGFGADLNLNEPIEFAQAVQLVDPTLTISATRLTFRQAKNWLRYIQLRDPNTSRAVVASIIGFGLTVDATIIGIKQTYGSLVTKLTAAGATGAPLLASLNAQYAPYAKLRTVNLFEVIPILNATLTALGQPNVATLPNIWTQAKAGVVAATNSTTFTAAMDGALLPTLEINSITLTGNFRAVADYIHTYFRRLQQGVGPDAGQYAINGTLNPNSAQAVEEGYNSAYGVSKRSNGLFIQRTAYEMLFGSRSHLTGNDIETVIDQHASYLDEDIKALNPGLVDGNKIGNQNPIYLDAVSQLPYDATYGLSNATARTRIVMTGKLTEIHTGRGDVDKVGLYRKYNGVAKYQSRCEYDNPGNTTGPLTSNARIFGEVLFAACPQSPDGGLTHDPLDYLVFNNNWTEVIDGKANDPTQFQPFREGDDKILTTVTSFISEVQRAVVLNYTGTTVFKGITLRRYVLDSKFVNVGDSGSVRNPFKNIEYRQVDEPGFVKAAPDGTVNALFIAGAPAVISKPHFLGGDRLALFSPWADGSFNPDPAKHETYIDIDPLSGKTFHAQKRLQANVEIRRSVMDASPHLEPLLGNFFVQQTDASFYMPWYWGEEAGAIKDDDASSYRTSIYKARDAGKILQIVGGVVSSIMFVLSVILIVRACTRQPDTTTSGSTDK